MKKKIQQYLSSPRRLSTSLIMNAGVRKGHLNWRKRETGDGVEDEGSFIERQIKCGGRP
jgi:hypothetical protein